MSEQNPHAVFHHFTKESHKLVKDFSVAESQEMVLQFTNAWSTIMTRTVESDDWFKMATDFYLKHTELWTSLFSLSGEDLVTPHKTDRRFSSDNWQNSPVHNYLKQSYLLTSRWLIDRIDESTLDDNTRHKCAFYTNHFIDALSPTNFALTNPDVVRETVESKGQNLLHGLKNLTEDMKKGRISMTDESMFEVGKNLATTPGSVVFENEMMQLIHYRSLADKVNELPMLIVPPCINKYYILDLQEKNSFVRYALEEGNNVFVISWHNPDETMGDRRWDEYVENGTIKAIDVVRKITGAKKTNAVSWCIGGTMLATTMAVLAARRRKPVASATFFTSLMDFSDPGGLRVFIDESQVRQHERKLKDGGVMPGKQLAQTFAMLRANELIWNYVINNYMKGKTPPPFDILYWNSDSTNMSAHMYTWYLRNMYLENRLAKPGDLELCGVKLDLGKIDAPAYFLSTIDDHIAPWKTTFTSTELVKGPIEFVLAASGHVAGVINPPAKNKRNYWRNGELGRGADHWLDNAERVTGSWWPHWSAWLKRQGGAMIDAPKRTGSDEFPELEPAPGAYVKGLAV